MALPLLLCETFLKRSWQRSAVLLAALIALGGLPADVAEARRARAAGRGQSSGRARAQRDGLRYRRRRGPAGHACGSRDAEDAGARRSGGPGPRGTAAGSSRRGAAPRRLRPPSPAPTASRPRMLPRPEARTKPARPPRVTADRAADHEESIWPTIARLFNFAVLVGGLIYFLRTPLAQHLASRSQQIRSGLVSARETSDRATAQLAELDRAPAGAAGSSSRRCAPAASKRSPPKSAASSQQAETEKARLVGEMQRDVASASAWRQAVADRARRRPRGGARSRPHQARRSPTPTRPGSSIATPRR